MFKSDNKNYGSLVKETRIRGAGRRKKEGREKSWIDGRKGNEKGGRERKIKKKKVILSREKSERGGKRKLELIL